MSTLVDVWHLSGSRERTQILAEHQNHPGGMGVLAASKVRRANHKIIRTHWPHVSAGGEVKLMVLISAMPFGAKTL
jgi:hypothetical protein